MSNADEEEILAVARRSYDTAKYGAMWTQDDHAALAALFRRLGQVSGEAWLRGVGFCCYLTLRRDVEGQAGVEIVGFGLTHEAATALAAGATWWAVGTERHPLVALGDEPGPPSGVRPGARVSCWELWIGGSKEAGPWIHGD